VDGEVLFSDVNVLILPVLDCIEAVFSTSS